MTNCNCECFCQELEHQGECECCFCDFENQPEPTQPYVHIPSRQEIEQELTESRNAVEHFVNAMETLDRQDEDFIWKFERYEFLRDLHQRNIFELTVALVNVNDEI